jgi:penicillin-binding protein 2
MLESPPPRRELEPEPLPLALRAAALGIIAAVLLGVLVTRLWALQILHADQYIAAAAQNTRYSVLPAERGLVVDDQGKVMVTNTATLAVQLNPGTLPAPIDCKGINKHHPQGLAAEPGCAVMYRLANVLQVPFKGPEGVVTQYWRGQKQNHGHPVVLSAVVTKPEVEYVKERMGQYPGVEFIATYQRDYTPNADSSANVLGHVGPITKEWLHSRFNRPRYLPRTGTMGQGGVELTYDRWLRGTDGKVAQVFDASGTPVGRSYLAAPAQQGSTLKLTIDSGLQKVAEQAIQHGINVAHANGSYAADAGAIVAINPDTGAILAQATLPTYKPSIWVPPFKGQAAVLKKAAAVSRDQSLPSPLLDEAVSGQFPAGSTFKPFTAAAAWNANILGPGSQLLCSSTFVAPLSHDRGGTVFHNYGPAAGDIDLSRALTISCDTFFYRVGDAFYGKYQTSDGHDQSFQRTLRKFGFGLAPAGFDLLSSSGVVPDRSYKLHDLPCIRAGKKKHHYVNSCGLVVTPNDAVIQKTWNPGDDINMAIGQGYLLVTPLQEAIAYSAIANGGKIVRPHVVDSILDPANDNAVVRHANTHPIRNLHLSPEFLNEVETGLHGATHDSDGTSSAVFGSYDGTPFDVWGKTGTAQTKSTPDAPDDAWWSGWASDGTRKIVVVAMIRNGGHGGVAAAPAALQVFQKFFHQKVTDVTPNSTADQVR